MNKTISLAAIAMVAVIMGMSAFAPAAMGARDGPHGNADVPVCHRGGVATLDDATDDEWVVLHVKVKALDGHLGHDDMEIPGDTSIAECPFETVYWSPTTM